MASHTTLQVQPPQLSTYNHPCGDLVDGGSRSHEYFDIAVPLYRASISGDLEAAQVILEGREYLVGYSINENKETPLHVAAGACRYDVVSYLVDMMSTVDLELQNMDGNTAFCIAVISRDVKMVDIMFRKNPALLKIPGRDNMMPLYLAAFHGGKHVVTFLYDQLMLDRRIGEPWKDDFMDGVLLKCIEADIFDVARRILEDNIQLPQEKHVWDMLQVLARKPHVFNQITTNPLASIVLSIYSAMGLRMLVMMFLKITYLKETDATLVLRLLWKGMMKKPKDVIDEILKGPMTLVKKKSTDPIGDILTGPVIKEHDEIETHPDQILFIAAEMNNKAFLVELIREYPDLVLKTNDDGQTIFHLSVSHLHHEIYRLLYEIGSMKDPITRMIDHEGNNILHLVGKNSEKNAFKDMVTTPYLLHNESLWYKEVEAMLPPPYRELKNTAGKTPRELFTENHKDLIKKDMKTINETINISMVVAALVCTIGFSVAYSIPGGFDQDTGFPIFLYNEDFNSFVILDVISFSSSTASIILFLSVILSRDQRDMRSLLKRWVIGQMLLLMSVYSLAMALIFSLRVLYSQSSHAFAIHIYGYSSIGLCVFMCYSLFMDLSKTYGGWYLFSPKKRTLYRKN